MAIDALRALDDAIGSLVVEGAAAHADPESIVALHRLTARRDAALSAALAAFDASGAWAPDGAHDATAWVATRCRLPKAAVRRQLRLGRALDRLPHCAAAWAAGDIASPHVGAIVSAAGGRSGPEELVRRDEEVLVGHARTLRFHHFTRAVAYWSQLADPDGADDADEMRRTRRDTFLEASFDGMFLGKMTLDPVSGSIVSGELSRLADGLFESDWAEARLRLGHDPTTSDLARTPAQRRADALVEMATRSRALPADGRRPAPLFSVLVGYETLHGRICQLAEGIVLAPGALVPWLDKAVVERAVFAPGRRVEVSASARLFTGATRRAIELRDRECAHPYCDRPAAVCEVDHIEPYGAGGLTTQENGRLLCPFHNRLRHQRPPPA